MDRPQTIVDRQNLGSRQQAECIEGFATPEGTRSYVEAHANLARGDFYHKTTDGLLLSSIGLGTYKGKADDATDAAYSQSLRLALSGGLNVIDSAIKYRATRSEKTLGRVFRDLIKRSEVQRREFFVSTKGGLIAIPDGVDKRGFVEAEVVSPLHVDSRVITDWSHCIEPVFLERELVRSRTHLGLATIDCYLLHNPETALYSYSQDDFYKKLFEIFELLEREVEQGSIRAYGMASWKGFRVDTTSPVYLDLKRILGIAKQVTADHHFKFLEVPLSVGMPAVLTKQNQRLQDKAVSTLEFARQAGINVLTSASVYEGRLLELGNLIDVIKQTNNALTAEVECLPVSLPRSLTSLTQLFELLLATKKWPVHPFARVKSLSAYSGEALYPQCLDVVRSLPEVSSSLVSYDVPEFLAQNLELRQCSPCVEKELRSFWHELTQSPSSQVP